MSNNVRESSQTPSNSSSSTRSESHSSRPPVFDSEVVERCTKLILDYRRQQIPKWEAILAIRSELIAVSRGEDDPTFKSGFSHYLDLLDSAREDDELEENVGSSRQTHQNLIDEDSSEKGSTSQQKVGRGVRRRREAEDEENSKLESEELAEYWRMKGMRPRGTVHEYPWYRTYYSHQ